MHDEHEDGFDPIDDDAPEFLEESGGPEAGDVDPGDVRDASDALDDDRVEAGGPGSDHDGGPLDRDAVEVKPLDPVDGRRDRGYDHRADRSAGTAGDGPFPFGRSFREPESESESDAGTGLPDAGADLPPGWDARAEMRGMPGEDEVFEAADDDSNVDGGFEAPTFEIESGFGAPSRSDDVDARSSRRDASDRPEPFTMVAACEIVRDAVQSVRDAAGFEPEPVPDDAALVADQWIRADDVDRLRVAVARRTGLDLPPGLRPRGSNASIESIAEQIIQLAALRDRTRRLVAGGARGPLARPYSIPRAVPMPRSGSAESGSAHPVPQDPMAVTVSPARTRATRPTSGAWTRRMSRRARDGGATIGGGLVVRGRGRVESTDGLRRLTIGRNVTIGSGVVISLVGTDASILIHDGVEIEDGARIESRGGRLVIGADTRLQMHTQIVAAGHAVIIGRDSVFAGGATVGDEPFEPNRSARPGIALAGAAADAWADPAVLAERAAILIGAGTHVGPNAHLAPGTRLASDSRVAGGTRTTHRLDDSIGREAA